MYLVGDVKLKPRRLVDITYECLMRGIAAVKPGATTGDIGHAIQTYAEGQERCSVVRDFCGHGVGKVFHALPNIVHYGKAGHGIALKPGMFFTIEPMINLGGYGVKILNDGWTAVTRDRSLSRPVRAHHRRDGNGLRDFHALAQGPRQAALWVNLRT